MNEMLYEVKNIPEHSIIDVIDSPCKGLFHTIPWWSITKISTHKYRNTKQNSAKYEVIVYTFSSTSEQWHAFLSLYFLVDYK